MGFFDSAVNVFDVATLGLTGVGAVAGDDVTGSGNLIKSGVNSILGEEVEASDGVNPFNITTATGSGAFNPVTGNIESQLSPEMQALFGGQVSGAQGAFGQVAGAGTQAQDLSAGFLSEAGEFDPFAAAEEQFGRLDAILEPGRTKARTGTAAGLLSTGRLGGTSGTDVQVGVEGEIERQRQGLLSEQFQGAQNVQDRLVNRGTSLGAFGTQQQLGQQAIGSQSLQNALGIDAQQQAALSTAGTISRGAPVAGQPGAFDDILKGAAVAGLTSLI